MNYMKSKKPVLVTELKSRDVVISKLRGHIAKLNEDSTKIDDVMEGRINTMQKTHHNAMGELNMKISKLTSDLGMKQILIDNGQRDVDNVVRDLELTNAVCDEMRSLIVRIAMGNS
jgi:hypothetical protein